MEKVSEQMAWFNEKYSYSCCGCTAHPDVDYQITTALIWQCIVQPIEFLIAIFKKLQKVD